MLYNHTNPYLLSTTLEACSEIGSQKDKRQNLLNLQHPSAKDKAWSSLKNSLLFALGKKSQSDQDGILLQASNQSRPASSTIQEKARAAASFHRHTTIGNHLFKKPTSPETEQCSFK
jgi:hypothetical protein